MKHSFKILFICLLALTFSSTAYAQYEVKDSYYFMKDDGEFSPEEKDEEAQYVFENCQNNFIQSVYLDCGCIAGEFRIRRDKGPLIPQNNLINTIIQDIDSGCANTTQIAGSTYSFCSEYARTFRSRNRNNKEYCECVANTTASEFKKKPLLNMRYIENIRSKALLSCK